MKRENEVRAKVAERENGVQTRAAECENGVQTRAAECDNKAKIEAAINGSEEAMAFLMTNAWPVVRGFLAKMSVPEHELPDLVQETLIRSMVNLDRFDPGKAKLHTWMCAIARNLYVDKMRKSKKEVYLEEQPEPMDERNDENRTAMRMDLSKGLAALPEVTRTAILMHHVQGMPVREISRLLRMPEGTVKSRIHYGLLKLGKEVLQYEG